RDRTGRAAGPDRGAVAADDRLVHPVRRGEARRQARGQAAELTNQAVGSSMTPTPVDLIAVLLSALLNPAVIVVAFWMGRHADQRQKLPVAAFAAALAGSVLIYVAVRLGVKGVAGVGRAAAGVFVAE